MDKQQQKSVKLKIEQPAIICSGRKEVKCFYRGKIVEDNNLDLKVINFKSFGQNIEVTFIRENCVTEGWEDLKIYK